MPIRYPRVFEPPARLRRFKALPRLLEKDLDTLFDQLNRRHFRGRLPRRWVRWSTRLKVAGQIAAGSRTILLGLEYHCHFPRDVVSTLKHEMVHIHYWDHDEAFRRECRRVGAQVYCKTYPGMYRPFRYVYACPSCGMEVRARRRLDSACADCGDGYYRDRYRLRLVRNLGRKGDD